VKKNHSGTPWLGGLNGRRLKEKREGKEKDHYVRRPKPLGRAPRCSLKWKEGTFNIRRKIEKDDGEHEGGWVQGKAREKLTSGGDR